MDNSFELPPLPDPMDYCYEWDGAWGTRKFSASQYNGRGPDRSVAIFTADQMRAYALAAVEAEREACARLCEEKASCAKNLNGAAHADACADAIRSRGKP